MSAIHALHTSELDDAERANLNAFLAAEHLGIDDVFIYRESGHAVVSYDTPEGLSAYYDATNGIDL